MSRRKLALAVLATVTVAATAVGMAVAGKGNGNNKTFEYAVGLWGDTPYSDVQAQTGVPNLIADLNSSDIAFSVHDGDLKAGNAIAGSVTPTTCQNATLPSIYSQGLGYFDSLREPAIFTPGDNDWTDCDRTSNGGFNSLGAAAVRAARLLFRRRVVGPAPDGARGADGAALPGHDEPDRPATVPDRLRREPPLDVPQGHVRDAQRARELQQPLLERCR